LVKLVNFCGFFWGNLEIFFFKKKKKKKTFKPIYILKKKPCSDLFIYIYIF
jgi:hypothetical protein